MSFVSQALKNEYLVHIKTFIVKNSKNIKDYSVETNKKIKKVQEQICELLKEKNNN